VSTAAGGSVKGVGVEDVNQRLLGSSQWLGSCGATVGSSRWWRLVWGMVGAAHPCGGTRLAASGWSSGQLLKVEAELARGGGGA
jgi:hypothetical protein